MSAQSRRILHCSVLACVTLVAYAYFVPPPSPDNFGTNNSVRFYLAKSLAVDKSFAIERYYLGGIDAAFYKGHYYSGKAPAASFLAVPVYWCVWQTIGRHFALPDWVYLYLVQMCVIALPSVLLVVLMHGFLSRILRSEYCADLLVVGYSLGTMAFPYSTQFVGHQLAAVLLFCCFLVLVGRRREPWEEEPRTAEGVAGESAGGGPLPTALRSSPSPVQRSAGSSLLAAGILGGLAVAADYQAMLILCVIFAFTAFSFRRPGDIAVFALGCVPGVFFILLYNYACFGNILSFPYAHEAMPIAREVQSQGLFGVRMPRLIPFMMLLVSPVRGIFFVSPFLLLVVPGLYSLARKVADEDDVGNAIGLNRRKLFFLCLISVLGYVLFNSSYGAWSGGSGYGPRFLVPAIPFFIIPIASLMAVKPKGYGALLAVLVAYSVLFHFVGTAGGPLAHEYLRNPVREFLLPAVLKGDVRPNWLTLLGCRGGISLAAIGAFIGGGIAFFLGTGRGRTGASAPRPFTRTDVFLLWLCILSASAMILLFMFHETEETAYRYAVIGHSYDAAGDVAMAIQYFEQSLRMDPAHPYVLRDLAGIYLRRGECRRALEITIRALAARPNLGDLQARCAAFMELCDLTDKIKASPGVSEPYLKRVRILERLGYPDIAAEAREKARLRIKK